jgi:prepilin-type N-terminal cleavage/methylation domain-containing protein
LGQVMKQLLQGKFKIFREQRGFTLFEVLIAVSILAAIGTGLLTAMDTNSRSTRTLDEKVVAASLAADYLEAIKASPYADTYPNAGENITIPFQYTMVVEIKCSSDGITFGNCTGSANETLQKLTTIVSREGRPVLSLCTYRTKR